MPFATRGETYSSYSRIGVSGGTALRTTSARTVTSDDMADDCLEQMGHRPSGE